MIHPFERLINDDKELDAVCIYVIAKVTKTSIKIFWPTLKPNDTQCNLFSHVYNEENGIYQANILWANTKPPSQEEWQKKQFKANHFTILADENLSINRIKPTSVSGLADAINDMSVSDETEDGNGYENDRNVDENKENITLEETAVEPNPSDQPQDQPLGQQQPKDSEDIAMDSNQLENPLDQEMEEESEQVVIVPDVIYHFRPWGEILKLLMKSSANEVLPDMKDLFGVDKNGQFYIVDATTNRRKHLNGENLEHRDFEGQWNGKKTKPNLQVFTREGPEQPLIWNKKYDYLMKTRQIVDKSSGEAVDQEFYLNSMVMLRYKSYHGKDVNYQRSIAYLLQIPSGMNTDILKRALYEYIGIHPGFKPHANRKVLHFLISYSSCLMRFREFLQLKNCQNI